MGATKIVGVLCAAVLAATGGCGGSEEDGPKGSAGSAGSGSSECKPTAAECYVAGSDGPGSECLAKADFSGSDKTRLRVTQHDVAKPDTLAAPYVQDAIITKKSALDQAACFQYGLAQYNLLMEIDTAQKSVTLGGGVPQALIGDPKDGTCWADFVDPSSNLEVKPVTASYTETADGSIEAKLASFVMPIYLEDKTNSDSYVLVPLHDMTFSAKLSSDKNCVGRYAHETLDFGASLCKPGQDQFAWENAGRYEGYITVEEADDVMVVSLGQTLCVVLSGDPSKWKGTNLDCKTSTGFQTTGGLPKGDYCSTTGTAGGCQDSWYLSIDFAAHAIPIKGTWVEGSGC